METTTNTNTEKNNNTNKENLLNKKVDRNFHSNGKNFKKAKNASSIQKQPSQGINKFTKIESLYNRARELYESTVNLKLIILGI
jgi:hypothetical protein